MGLLGNYNVLSKSPGRQLGGTTQSGDRSNFSKTGAMRNRFQVFARFNATPSGYEPPYSWVLAQIGGGLASFTRLTASGTLTADMAGGINLEAALAASGVITTANMDLVVALAASLTAGGSITTANLVGTVELAASLAASGAITTANLGLLAGLTAALSASISTSANLTGLAHMSASISSLTELSPASLAEAVLSAIVEGGTTVQDVLAVLVAYAAGKTTINNLGGGNAEVVFRNLADTIDRIAADVTGSERTDVVIDTSDL